MTRLPFDIHLMCVEPERLIEQFAETADTINVHIEVSPHINRTLDAIRKLGKRAGVCINPGTPVSGDRGIAARCGPGDGDDDQSGMGRPADDPAPAGEGRAASGDCSMRAATRRRSRSMAG